MERLNEVCGILLVLGSFLFHGNQGQTVCSGSKGSSYERSSYSANSGYQRFLVSSNTFTCHGQVESYEFYRRAPYCYNMQFQIWRPVDVAASRYMLLGVNDYVDTGTCFYWNSTYYTRGIRTYNPMSIEEVPIQPGDVYGWSDSNPSSTTRTLSYYSAPTGSGTYDTVEILNSGLCNTGIGLQCDWSVGQTTVRDYSLKIYLTSRQNPYFTNLPAMTRMLENSPASTFVYQVRGWNHFSYTNVIDPDIRYSIIGGTCGATRFSIEPITGVITIASIDALNHEAHLSGTSSTCTVTVRVSEGPYTGSQDLTIDIQDVNEPHTVTNLPEQKTIDASTAGDNYVVHDVEISDVDTNQITVFPAKTYRIEYTLPANPPFDIDSNGIVRTTQNMANWAGPTRFILGITVEDDTYSDGPRELTIEITNLRTKPIITNVDYSTSVPENSDVANTMIFQVAGDSQPDARGDPVKFFMIRIFPLDTAVDTFAIDQTTGWVTHKANPGFDYFGTRLYDLELEVRDSDNMYVSERKNLSIEITWVNKAPEITTTFQSTIDEKVPVGTILPDVELDGTDRDISVGDWIDYAVYGTDSYLFYADNVTKRIYVTQEIKVPAGLTQTVYNLQLLVHDSHGESATTTLTVTVLDINDNAPIFDPDYYTGSILEISPGETYTGVTVRATDEDGGNNQKIDYFILEDIGNLYFQVDSAGKITNKQPIPYEVHQNITFTVVAADRGVPSLNDTATIFIEIKDANNKEPYYDPDFYSMDLRSDTRIGTDIHVIPTLDQDSSAVQTMSYYWLNIQDYFRLDSSNGIISVARELMPFQKYLLYTASKDNGLPTTYDSDPYSMRVDTYLAESTLIDIYLDIPLEQFLSTVDQFMRELDKIVSPWDMRLESCRLEDTSTVTRVYAVESSLPDLKENQNMQKTFIDEDKLILMLRKNLRGDPREILTKENFAPWKPYKVQPAYPVWIIDTLEGVIVLSFLCIALLVGLITMLVLLSKKYRWGCYRYRPKTNKRKIYPTSGEGNHFKLNYINKALEKPFFISTNKLLGNTYSGLFPPNTINSKRSPPITKINNDHSLPPVQTPDLFSSEEYPFLTRGAAA